MKRINVSNDSYAIKICKEVCASFKPSDDKEADYKSIIGRIGKEVFDNQQSTFNVDASSSASELNEAQALLLLVNEPNEFHYIDNYVKQFLAMPCSKS